MKKYLIPIVIIILVLALLSFFDPVKPPSNDFKNMAYLIGDTVVILKDGVSEINTPESSSKTVARYFGNEVYHDINGDGKDDAIFLITQQTGGTGTFYYVVASVSTDNGYVGSHAVYIGDRIAPQTTEINEKGFVVVNYADRAPGESFATQPSVGKSIWLKFDPATLEFGEVVQNFEGESR